MNRATGLNFLLGIFLTGSTVVADDVNLATGQQASADLIRRFCINSSSSASATEAVSATTVAATPRRLSVAAATWPPEQMNEEKNNLRVATAASPSLSGDGASPLPSTNALPSLPSGVSELKFSEFFRQPIGPRGLEYTEKLRSLEGRRIRILGYMVRQEQPVEHGFLLSPVPLTLHESEYGLADDLPVTALHVFTTKDLPARIPHTPGPMLLTGKLSLGNRNEADGRTSVVRLHLDPPTPEQRLAAEQAVAALEKKKSSAGHHDHSGHGHAH